jgi:hypothetical protein
MSDEELASGTIGCFLMLLAFCALTVAASAAVWCIRHIAFG